MVKVLHSGESRVNGGRASFDCEEGIEPTYGSFEWCQTSAKMLEPNMAISDEMWVYKAD